MTQAKPQPFVVIWSPKDKDAQPELNKALAHLSEPDGIAKIQAIAKTAGVSGLEFQLYDVDTPEGEPTGKLGIKLCFDHGTLTAEDPEALPTMRQAIKHLIGIDASLVTDEYQGSGEKRIYHDNVHTRIHGLVALHDSRPVVAVNRGA